MSTKNRVVDPPTREKPVAPKPDTRPKTLFILPFSVTPTEYQTVTDDISVKFPEEPVVSRPLPRLGDSLFYFLVHRSQLPVMIEREDLTTSAWIVSPNAAGVQLIAGVAGKQIKLFKWGYHSTVDGQHFLYFGTSTTAPTLGTSPTNKAFGVSLKTGHYRQTEIHPEVSAAGDGLYLYCANQESSMSADAQYVQE